MERCTDAYYNAISNSATLFTELAKTDTYTYDVVALRDLSYNLFSLFLESVPALQIVETLYIADVESTDEKYIWWSIGEQIANLTVTNITTSLMTTFNAFNKTWNSYQTTYKVSASSAYNTTVGYYAETLFSDVSKGVFLMNAVKADFNESSRAKVDAKLIIFENKTCIKQYESTSICSETNNGSTTSQFISGITLETQKQGVILPRSV